MNGKTIGVLLDSLYNTYEAQLWQDVIRIARERELNLVCYALRKLHPVNRGEEPGRIFYRMINPANLQGVIAFSNTLINTGSIEELLSFYKALSPLPLVSLGLKMEGFPAVALDNRQGMRSLMVHLLKRHGFNQPAFIKGPSGNREAEIRWQVYRSLLKEYKLEYRPEAVVEGDFLRESGPRAVEVLMDQRKVSFDVLICCNDYMALGAVDELMRRGVRVPEDVAVTGFDDIVESRCGLQPLTTVRQPIYELARSAVELLLTLLSGKKIVEDLVLPAVFTPRRSCGCYMHSDTALNVINEAVSPYVSIREQKKLDQLIRETRAGMEKYFLGLNLAEESFLWAEKLVTSLSNTMYDRRNEKTFFLVLENVILNSVELGVEALQWYPVVAVVFESFKKIVNRDFHGEYLDKLWKQALIYVGNIADYRLVYTNVDYRGLNFKLHTISEALKNIYDKAKLTDIIARQLGELGIRRFFLIRYNLKDTRDAYGKVLLGYDEAGALTSVEDFPVREILPLSIKTGYNHFAFLVFPLWLKEIPFGYVVFEIGRLEGSVFEAITQHLDISLQGAGRFNLMKQQTLELETKVTLQTHLLESARRKVADEQQEKERTLELLRRKEQQILHLQQQLEEQSQLDRLTRLFNRDALFTLIQKEMKRTRRNVWRIERRVSPHDKGKQDFPGELKEHLGFFSILMLNIDNFKQINARYGPDVGDRILVTLGSLLKQEDICRQEDIPCRFSSTEFVIILPHTNEKNAANAAVRLAAAVGGLRFIDDLTITVSIGIAEYTPEGNNTFSIIHNAEEALALAEQTGKNKIVLFSELKKGKSV